MSSTALHFGQPTMVSAASNGLGARSSSASLPVQSHDWHNQRSGLTGRSSGALPASFVVIVNPSQAAPA